MQQSKVGHKPVLILLSDLWGKEKSGWIENYSRILKDHLEVRYYDSCELGEVDKSVYKEGSPHKRFIDGGIDKAVENLIKREQGNAGILAFSESNRNFHI